LNAADVDILVLSEDPQLLHAVEEAVHGQHRVHVTGNTAEAADLAASNLVGVLVTDVALDALPGTIQPIELRAPGLVTIVAGDRDHGSELLQLNTGGPIFRFLLKPVSTGQLRLYVEAAARHHVELLARGAEPPTLTTPVLPRAPRSPRMLGAAGIAAAFLTLGVWLVTSRPQEVALEKQASAPVATTKDDVLRLLAEARRAESEGRVVEPPENNALDLYLEVLAIEPNQLRASQKLAEIADLMFERAESALAAGQLEDAQRAIADAKRALPGHPRLSYFATRLEVQEQRSMITQALQAAGSGDIGGAAGLIEEAAQVRLGESGAVVEARAELARRAAVQEQIDGFLRLSLSRTAEAQLFEPADDNALHYLRAARAAGARDEECAPARDALVAAMLAEAATATEAGRFEVARAWVERARELAPASEAIVAAETTLATAVERSERLAQWHELVVERLTQGRLMEAGGDDATDYLARLHEEAPAREGLSELDARVAEALLDDAQGAIVAGNLDEAGRLIEAADALGVMTPALARTRSSFVEAKRAALVAASAADPKLLPLVRRKYVPPHYPAPAERRQIEGRVELELTVDASGKVKSVEVTSARPRDTFERAAVAAAEQWEYQPAQVDGTPVEARTLVAIDFSLE
jgi:protein TonB